MGSRRVLDTNVLCNCWRKGRHATAKPIEDIAESDVALWAEELIERGGSNAILTPIRLEMLAGTRSARELALMRKFLGCFTVADGGHVIDQDWQEAERLVSRTPRDGGPRQLVDCLIRAIACRLRMEVSTRDKRFPRGR